MKRIRGDSLENQKMAGATGGIQGWKGTLFGIPYAADSLPDKVAESFGGPHDLIGGQKWLAYSAHIPIEYQTHSSVRSQLPTSRLPQLSAPSLPERQRRRDGALEFGRGWHCCTRACAISGKSA